MVTPYGVDPTGRPVGQGQPSTGQQTACPSGQKRDDQGNCVPSESTQAPAAPTSLTGNTAQPASTPAPVKYLGQESPAPAPAASGGVSSPMQAAAPNYGQNAAPEGVDATIKGIISSKNLVANQNNTGALQDIVNELRAKGINAQMDVTDSNGHNGGILVNGQSYQLIDGSNHWTNLQPWQEGASVGNFLGGSGGSSFSFNPTTPAPAPYAVKPYTGSGALPTYNAAQFTQAPNFSSTLQAPTSDLIQRLLSSEGSMNPAVVAQMKEAQKGSALEMADQLKQQYNTDAASRGVAGGGANLARLGGVDASTMGNISKGYRDTDIAAATTNRADQLNALGASTGFQNQLLNQYLGQNAQNLNVQTANAGEQQKQFQSEQAKAADEYQRYLSEEQLGLQGNDQAFQQWAAQQGIQLTQQNYAMMQDQFNKTYGLNVGRFLAGA